MFQNERTKIGIILDSRTRTYILLCFFIHLWNIKKVLSTTFYVAERTFKEFNSRCYSAFSLETYTPTASTRPL